MSTLRSYLSFRLFVVQSQPHSLKVALQPPFRELQLRATVLGVVQAALLVFAVFIQAALVLLQARNLLQQLPLLRFDGGDLALKVVDLVRKSFPFALAALQRFLLQQDSGLRARQTSIGALFIYEKI